MMRSWQADLWLLFSAIIWGGGFIASKDALSVMGPFTFTAWRFLLASALLFLIYGKRTLPKSTSEWRAGLGLGVVLGLGYAFQNIGLLRLKVGKAGFLTGLAIIIVPLMESLFFKRLLSRSALLSVGISTIGLAFLCLNESLTPEWYDLWLLATAIMFSLQILGVTRYGKRYSVISLATIQLLASGIITIVLACIFEHPRVCFTLFSGLDLLYTACLGTSLTFLIQLKAQPYTTPTRAALIMAMESPCAAALGWLLRGETLSTNEWIGCALLSLGILVVEWKRWDRSVSPLTGGPVA